VPRTDADELWLSDAGKHRQLGNRAPVTRYSTKTTAACTLNEHARTLRRESSPPPSIEEQQVGDCCSDHQHLAAPGYTGEPIRGAGLRSGTSATTQGSLSRSKDASDGMRD
jgi:hypothetical protein